MRTMYFDCFSGASGNMILGALLAAGVDREVLIGELSKLKLSGYEIVVSSVNRSGIAATLVDVKVPPEHSHRHLSDIEAIISDADLSAAVKSNSLAIFTRLAEAEARVHGTDIEEVHFHEVGALDAIIDIVGACIGFEALGIEHFVCSRIHVGSGFVEMSHGRFPVPPPAVTELLEGFPIYSTEVEGELITPTGAAIISTLCTVYGRLPNLIGEIVAYGAGSREYERFPNVLRVIIGTGDSAAPEVSASAETPKGRWATEVERLLLLETNVDDSSPQVLGFVMERAFELGALDCWFTPIQMKKNRPAVTLSILSKPGLRGALTELLYRETTSLGIRVSEIERRALDRRIVSVETAFGHIDVKLGLLSGDVVNAMPEYEQVKQAALRHSVPYRAVSDAALAALGEKRLAAAK